MKTYFCFFEYLATGEGLTFSMAIVGANSKKDAKEKFTRKYICNEATSEEHAKSCTNYFSKGVDVYEWQKAGNSVKIKEILTKFFSQSVIDSMFNAEKFHAMHEFNFKLYTNYS
jgi:hypothetical protein